MLASSPVDGEMEECSVLSLVELQLGDIFCVPSCTTEEGSTRHVFKVRSGEPLKITHKR